MCVASIDAAKYTLVWYNSLWWLSGSHLYITLLSQRTLIWQGHVCVNDINSMIFCCRLDRPSLTHSSQQTIHAHAIVLHKSMLLLDNSRRCLHLWAAAASIGTYIILSECKVMHFHATITIFQLFPDVRQHIRTCTAALPAKCICRCRCICKARKQVLSRCTVTAMICVVMFCVAWILHNWGEAWYVLGQSTRHAWTGYVCQHGTVTFVRLTYPMGTKMCHQFRLVPACLACRVICR